MKIFESIGIDPGYIIIGLFVAVLVMIVLYIIMINKFNKYKETYDSFMQGKDGKDLETAIMDKFSEIDKIKEQNEFNSINIEEIAKSMKYTFQKFGIVKYDAFKEMGGKLSFSLCMLTDNNDGFIITSVHSTNEGCYIYIKEIIKGEPYVLLSEEEKKALAQTKNRKSALDD
ncbi:MAG: DUF4446 family protein [Lachnospiraceae bacterium]|nr:DUF4446 family protein [Lachnospiraceae bacterium]